MKQSHLRITAVAILALFAVSAWAGVPILSVEQLSGLSLLCGVGNIELVTKALDNIEKQLEVFATKAETESKMGQVSADTKAAIEGLGIKQREIADRLLIIEQKATATNDHETKDLTSWGAQFCKSDAYGAFVGGQTQKARFEIKNTLVGSDTNVAPDRKPGIVPGAFQKLTIESLYRHVPTTSNAVEFTKEASFTNNAAEASEGAQKAESALTWSLVNMPISTVAHWIKISRQLAADNAALAAYVDLRMRYGVNRKVETQLVAGDGTAPNISGILDSGNYTAHGYVNADLGSTLKKLVLIRKIIGDLQAAGYEPNGIVLNPADWSTIEIDIFTGLTTVIPYSINEGGQARLFGVPVIWTVGMTADSFVVGDFGSHGTIHDRENVVVEMSDSDSDNFTKNLITLRAERRLALASEVPAAVRGGDLTPA